MARATPKSNLRLYTVIGQQDVFRFEIAVEDAFAVCRLHRGGDRRQDPGAAIRLEAPFPGELVPRIVTANQLHYQVGRTGLQQAIVEDVDNRWMLQPRQRLRLLLKARV